MPQKAPKTVLSVSIFCWPKRLCRVFWNSLQKNKDKLFLAKLKCVLAVFPGRVHIRNCFHVFLVNDRDCVCVCVCVCVCACARTQSCPILSNPVDCVACQAPLSIDSSRQGYWSGVPFPTAGGLPDPGIELASPALADRFFIITPLGKRIFILFLFESLCLLRTYSICLGTR